MRVKTLQVSTPTGDAGRLQREAQYIFNYAATERVNEVSLTMPIRAQSYASTPLMPVFSMNLPEGYLYDLIARRVAKHERIDDMRLLAITGRQQIGRLQFLPPGEQWEAPPAQVGLSQLLHQPASRGLFDFLVETYFQSGISGVQPKVLMPDADHAPSDRITFTEADLIVKSGAAEYPWLTQNEFLCMDAARRAGLDVPEFWLSDDGNLFVLRRFDLQPERLGFEDMAVLMGKARDPQGNYKYQESYEAIARILAAFSGPRAADNLHAFFASVALSVMVRNGDAHLKNFGMLYRDPGAGEARLAPIYDVVTTTIYPYYNQRTGQERVDRTMALKLFSGAKTRHYPTRDELLRFGKAICLVSRPDEVLDRIATALSETLAAHSDRLEGAYGPQLRAEWQFAQQSLAAARGHRVAEKPNRAIQVDATEPDDDDDAPPRHRA
ncbi:MAG: type II toxin-antitoxin system HipA family toxin [Luteimonas sp.]